MSIDELMHRAQVGWIIDICAECGALARWPFCEHRSETQAWTLAITVKATDAGRAQMLKRR